MKLVVLMNSESEIRKEHIFKQIQISIRLVSVLLVVYLTKVIFENDEWQ